MTDTVPSAELNNVSTLVFDSENLPPTQAQIIEKVRSEFDLNLTHSIEQIEYPGGASKVPGGQIECPVNSIPTSNVPGGASASLGAHRGTLIVYMGPMYSGKTTRLNYELTRFADKGLSTLKIIHSDDVRDDVASADASGSTHNSSYRTLSDKITCIRASALSGIDVSRFHAIGIDESQFYPDLYKMVEQWVEVDGKHVRVSGLDGDAFKRKFGQTLDLIPMCDRVKKLNASCVICLAELEKRDFHGNIFSISAPFTKRLGTSTEQKEVGGSSRYIPVCRYHHVQ